MPSKKPVMKSRAKVDAEIILTEEETCQLQ